MSDRAGQKPTEADQHWLAALVESSRDAIIGKTPNGIVISENTGAQKMFGDSAEEIIPNSTVGCDQNRSN